MQPKSDKQPRGRRKFLAGLSGGISALATLNLSRVDAQGEGSAERPNILWLTCEDMSPQLGCYGEGRVKTPQIDALAAEGLRYTFCWSNAPVCAPARTTLITGAYPASLGAEHMRSVQPMPAGQMVYPQLLRQLGYYCTNNTKQDYNVVPNGKEWDESSRQATWRKRPGGRPFFAVFNFETTHESQVRKTPHSLQHDPAKVRVPAYHPDTPEVRRDWAQYLDNIETMDGQVGKVLRDLEADGLKDETIIFFYSDHGAGMPRSKRWPYNSGLRVPLVVRIPEKWKALRPPEYRAGGTSDRLVSFVDFAPTLLSLAGEKKAAYHQGHPFLGRHLAPRQEFLYGFRGRMDERIDLVRSVTDGRYVYLRQYMPHRIYGQYIDYMFEMPTTRVWKRLFDEGKLTAEQSRFWKEKEVEELYDLETDPDEVKNLAGDRRYAKVLAKLRKAEAEQAVRIGDRGFLPEEQLHEAYAATAPLQRIQAQARLAAGRDAKAIPALEKGLTDGDLGVRYWSAVGLRIRQRPQGLAKLLADPAASVRVVAGETLGLYGTEAERGQALEELVRLANMQTQGIYVALQAISALTAIGKGAAPVKEKIAALPKEKKGLEQRLSSYVPRAIEYLLEQVG